MPVTFKNIVCYSIVFIVASFIFMKIAGCFFWGGTIRSSHPENEPSQEKNPFEAYECIIGASVNTEQNTKNCLKKGWASYRSFYSSQTLREAHIHLSNAARNFSGACRNVSDVACRKEDEIRKLIAVMESFGTSDDARCMELNSINCLSILKESATYIYEANDSEQSTTAIGGTGNTESSAAQDTSSQLSFASKTYRELQQAHSLDEVRKFLHKTYFYYNSICDAGDSVAACQSLKETSLLIAAIERKDGSTKCGGIEGTCLALIKEAAICMDTQEDAKACVEYANAVITTPNHGKEKALEKPKNPLSNENLCMLASKNEEAFMEMNKVYTACEKYKKRPAKCKDKLVLGKLQVACVVRNHYGCYVLGNAFYSKIAGWYRNWGMAQYNDLKSAALYYEEGCQYGSLDSCHLASLAHQDLSCYYHSMSLANNDEGGNTSLHFFDEKNKEEVSAAFAPLLLGCEMQKKSNYTLRGTDCCLKAERLMEYGIVCGGSRFEKYR